jgi:hypothetical protein
VVFHLRHSVADWNSGSDLVEGASNGFSLKFVIGRLRMD